jgi:pimeloyl-ACP methyl ester carboxylesterase
VQSRTDAAWLRECDIRDVDGRVLCGTFEVSENRQRPNDRRIGLRVLVLKATGDTPQPDAFMPLAGGPGQAATAFAAMDARTYADIRRNRDIVLVDVRGTGGSNPLHCDIASAPWVSSPDVMPPGAIRACRATLAQRADLRMYTTEQIARDLDELRAALGIERWNVFGASYGTRLAQEYTRAFGARVRTLTLHGIAAPSLAIPLPYARDAQATVDRLFDEQTRKDLVAVLAALAKAPVKVSIESLEVMVSAGNLSEALRHMLYNAAAAPAAADIVRAAAAGDYTPAAREVLRERRTFTHDFALGLFLSVTCAEDVARIDETAISMATRDTFLGDYRVRQQMEACRNWDVGTAPRTLATPLTSNVPALLISGEVDPVTPARMGAEVARTLPNARHVVLARHGHTLSIGRGCMRAALARFVESATTAGIDFSCVPLVTRHWFTMPGSTFTAVNSENRTLNLEP